MLKVHVYNMFKHSVYFMNFNLSRLNYKHATRQIIKMNYPHDLYSSIIEHLSDTNTLRILTYSHKGIIVPIIEQNIMDM
jgi:hypothetical protein